jgi:hypothetical protein
MSAATLVKPTSPKTTPKVPHVKKGVSRLAINLPNQVLEELKDLADEESVTVTEIVRRAISAERFLRGHIEAGNQLLVLEKDQSTPSRVVVFR